MHDVPASRFFIAVIVSVPAYLILMGMSLFVARNWFGVENADASILAHPILLFGFAFIGTIIASISYFSKNLTRAMVKGALTAEVILFLMVAYKPAGPHVIDLTFVWEVITSSFGIGCFLSFGALGAATGGITFIERRQLEQKANVANDT